MEYWTRRDFITRGAASLALLALPRNYLADILPGAEPPPAPLGRIASWGSQPVRALPTATANLLSWKRRDEVIPLYAQIVGEPPWPTNPVWYLTERGYIHSGYVQPVDDKPESEVITEVERPGFWAQVCVPYAEARWLPSSRYVAHKLYYDTVYRVVRAVEDEAGDWWYQLHEGITWSPGPYVPSWSVRRIRPEELTPIAPGFPDKWMKIEIAKQTLTCYHGRRPVFHRRVASGTWRTPTPLGEYRIVIQRHTRRMMGTLGGSRYDLPGVAFPVYFNWSGAAIHGTYWHNDFGRRHSRGCVNLTSEDARWLFRWVEPHVPYSDYTVQSRGGEGTPVVVV